MIANAIHTQTYKDHAVDDFVDLVPYRPLLCLLTFDESVREQYEVG